jgi:alpha-amylase
MASVCFYFQVHQPFRLRRYSVFATDPFYFDNEANQKICLKVADKCYRPTTAKILDLVKRHEGRFRVAYSISGVCIEQMKQWCPDVIDMFKELAQTGACEFINETTHHSLSFLFSRSEFDEQVANHERLVRETFGVSPTIFRNTELIYSDELAAHIARRGRHRAILCEGVDGLLGYRSPNYVYVPPEGGDDLSARPVKLLLKNFRLSDDIAFRFSNRGWKEWPLSAEKFAKWVNQINGDGYCCNLFMDYETFGEHQWADTGIFEFLDALPGLDLRHESRPQRLPHPLAGHRLLSAGRRISRPEVHLLGRHRARPLRVARQSDPGQRRGRALPARGSGEGQARRRRRAHP